MQSSCIVILKSRIWVVQKPYFTNSFWAFVAKIRGFKKFVVYLSEDMIYLSLRMMNRLTQAINAIATFLLVLSANLKAQEPYALNITHKDGLPSNTVFQVFQDSKGFIWIAHQEGLSRYDGFEFLSYHSPQQNSKAGSFISEDIVGRIWYENFDGQLFYVKNDSLNYFSKAKSLGYVPYCISENYLFVLQFERIQIFDIRTLSLVKTINGRFKEIEYAVCIGKQLIVISDNVLYKLNDRFELTSNSFFIDKSVKTKQIIPYKNQFFVFSRYNESQKLYVFDLELNHLYTERIPEPEFIQGGFILQDKLWLASSHGAVIYDLPIENGQFKRIFNEKSISNALYDAQGNYWISTLNNGIFLLSLL